MSIRRVTIFLILLTAGFPAGSVIPLFGEGANLATANELYQHTEYRESLRILSALGGKDAGALRLIGQNYFMLGDYRKATESMEKAVQLAPNDPEIVLWLGRTYGRRAETSGPFTAPGWATKSRQMLEKAVHLSPENREAVGDLFDYYLGAPEFLGGGEAKAEELASRVAMRDPAEAHYYQALLDEHRHRYPAAEQHYRAAIDQAPDEPLRVMDLAKFVASRGRVQESDALFDRAQRMAPDQARILFERANIYIKEHRNLADARRLLEQYLRAPLTPSDPSRHQAEVLLKKL